MGYAPPTGPSEVEPPPPFMGYAPPIGPHPSDTPPYQPLPSLYQPALYTPQAIDSHTHIAMTTVETTHPTICS